MSDITKTAAAKKKKVGRSIIALDIGTSAIKLVQIEKRQTGYFLSNYAISEIPYFKTPDKKVIIETIKEVINKAAISENKVYINIYGPSLNVRYTRMPQMSDKEINKAIRWGALKFITFDPEEAIIKHLLLGEVTEKDQKKIDLMIAAVHQKFVYEQMELIKSADLQLAGISINPYALYMAYRNFPDFSPMETVCLVDIGASIVGVNIVSDGKLCFSRNISAVGGRNLTQAISDKLGIDFNKAEEIKKNAFLPGYAQAQAEEIKQITRFILEELIIEIDRSLHFFMSQSSVKKIDNIIVSGGGILFDDIKGYLSKNLNVPVKVFNSFSNIEIDKTQFDTQKLSEIFPRLAVALGMALSVEVKKRHRLDLLPEEVYTKKELVQIGKKVFTFTLVELLILGVLYLPLMFIVKSYNWQIEAKNKAISEEQKKIDTTIPSINKVNEINSKIKIPQAKTEFLQKLVTRERKRSNVISQLGKIIPKEVWLTEINLLDEQRTLQIKGAATSNTFITEFLGYLRKESWVEAVDLKQIQGTTGPEQVMEFEIICKMIS